MNVSITVTLPMKLLIEIEENIEGKNRSEKLRNCIKVGYEQLTSKPTVMDKELTQPYP